MPLTLQTTTILAEFVGTKQRWSWYPAGVKIRHRAGNSSRQLDQFEARATRKTALRYSVSVGRSERPLRPVPATAPRHTECQVVQVGHALLVLWGMMFSFQPTCALFHLPLDCFFLLWSPGCDELGPSQHVILLDCPTHGNFCFFQSVTSFFLTLILSTNIRKDH